VSAPHVIAREIVNYLEAALEHIREIAEGPEEQNAAMPARIPMQLRAVDQPLHFVGSFYPVKQKCSIVAGIFAPTSGSASDPSRNSGQRATVLLQYIDA
jgi:hypothetical protein